MDRVDRISAQWQRERPEIDHDAMALIGRIARLSRHLGLAMDKTFAAHDLNAASFDVLATLRRSGAPFRLSPGELLASTMVTSGTMTHRIDRLEREGLVTRVGNPDDARSVLIELTPEGRARIDAAVTDHTATQTRLTAGLSPEEQAQMTALLRKLLVGFETG
ncbi:MarR family winged helix-turn-helix transcriptional regulator [Nioella aestuarii]|uniref:MarR family winged helix-turn-helix transcriptional regulator n=1 Tax=Nioella aestuarii TaxID=1662864 RepID=UPI003D7F7140